MHLRIRRLAHPRKLRALLGALAVCLSGAQSALAQSSSQDAAPVVVAGVASVDRILDDLDFVASAAGEPGLAEHVRGVLANLNNLQGIDRSRPVGLLVFPPQQLGAEPRNCVFVPVANVDDLLKTAQLGTTISLQRGADDDRLSFVTPEKTIPVRLRHGFAYLSEDSGVLDMPLPDPQPYLQELLTTYDVAVSIRRDGVPQSMQQFVLSMAEQVLSAQIRPGSAAADSGGRALRSDDEEARKLGVDVALAVLRDVERLDIGFVIDRTAPAVRLRAELRVKSGGAMAAALTELSSGPPRFLPQLETPQPFALVMHAMLPERLRSLIVRAVDSASSQFDARHDAEAEALRPAVQGTLDSFRESLQAGALDGFLQIAAGDGAEFVIIGGAAVAKGEQIAKALSLVLPFAKDDPKVKSLVMDAERIEGVSVHRIDGAGHDQNVARLYGERASLLVGASPDAVWTAFGQHLDASTALKTAITADGDAPDATRSAPAPLLAAQLHLTDWLGVLATAEDDGMQQLAAAARRAFPQPEQDRIELRLTGGADGLQLELSFEEGFLRLIGEAVRQSRGM